MGVLWLLLHPLETEGGAGAGTRDRPASPEEDGRAVYVAAAAPGSKVCQGGVEQAGPPWYFEGPGAEEKTGAGCADGVPAALPPEEAARRLGRPLPAIYYGLYPDGRVLPLEVTVVVWQGGKLLLGAQAPCPAGAGADGGQSGAGAADGGQPGAGAADGGQADGGAGAPGARCPPGEARGAGAGGGRPGGRPLALLPRKEGEVATPAVLDPRVLSGSVRRMIGRKSLAARGRFVGEGQSVAAVFKLRGQTVQLAVFGEGGGLRLHQSVRWRGGRGASAKPVALYTVPGLTGPAQGPGGDGLLLIGEGDDGAVPLLIQFEGKALRTYP